MFITFIYRIENNPKTYYGKYCTDYISDDHEGLDQEVSYRLLSGINKYRKQKKEEKITENNINIGVLSFSWNRYIPVYSSDKEIKCFDFYYENNDNGDETFYINGKSV